MHRRTRKLFTLALIVVVMTAVFTWTGSTAYAENQKPKLVLQITIDQMRGDFPMRYKDQLGEGGFRYLMEKEQKPLADTYPEICSLYYELCA